MNRAQIKMGENIAVLLLFIVLLTLGIIFYVQYHRGSLQEAIQEQRIKEAVELSQRVSYLPEVQCSEDGIQRENCYDWIKLEKASVVFKENSNFYHGILGYSTVDVLLVYPENKKVRLYHNIKPGTINEEKSQVPIAVYIPHEERYVFGILEVTVYG